MTQVTMETLEAGGFEGIIKEGAEAFEWTRVPLPCFVHHRDAGGWCERDAAMEAYDIPFCEVHGAEIKAGILAEIYHDAGKVLEAEAAALVLAYPVAKLEERVDPETTERDYHKPNPNKDPVDIFFDARMYTLRLMRLSWSAGQNWMLEVLEEEREGASAQQAFALALRAQKTGQAV